MSKSVRMLPKKYGNPPVFVYRGETLRPWKPDWDLDDPYEHMPKPGSPMVLLDLATGQEAQFYVWESYQAPARLDWADVSRRFFGHVACSGDYNTTEMRVLLALFARIGLGNAAIVNQRELGEELGIRTRSTISKTLAALVEKGALVRVEIEKRRAGALARSGAYRLNANLGATAGQRLGRTKAMLDAQAKQDRSYAEYMAGQGAA